MSPWNVSNFTIPGTWKLTNHFCHSTRGFGQGASCNWTEKEECSVVRYLFTGRFRDSDEQSTVIHNKNPDPAGTLKLAMEANFFNTIASGWWSIVFPQTERSGRKNQNPCRSCYFCGNRFSSDHRKKYLARDIECRSYKK